MARLVTAPNLGAEADALYAELVAAHRDLTPEAGRALDARLILLLMNHVGDPEALREALRLAQPSASETVSQGLSSFDSAAPKAPSR